MRISVLPVTICALALGHPAFVLADGVIRGRIQDADTKLPIAATLSVSTEDGRILADHPSFRGGFRVEGNFEKPVPSGKLHIVVSRGFDYGAVEQTIAVRDGETKALAFELRRRTPLKSLGWVTGDSHIHMVHGERTITVDFPFVGLSGRAEGLDYLSLAQQWNLPSITPESLDAATRAASTDEFTMAWNVEAPKNFWRGDVGQCAGHGWTLGMRGRTPDGRDAIEELLSMSAWDYESEKPPYPNFEIQALIHAQGGIVSYSHPQRWWSGKWGGKGIYPLEEHKFISNLAQELPFDTVAGPTYDMLDILMRTSEREVNRKGLALWFLLLNHGYRIAGTASSDATFDNPGGGVPGAVRVYTKVEGRPTLERVAAAMKAGRNFVTSGPLVVLRMDGHEAGDVVKLSAKRTVKVDIQAWASGKAGERLSRVELIRNGEVIRTVKVDSADFQRSLPVEESETAWYVVRCYGSTDAEVAVTNPIYFESASYRAPEPAAAHVSAKLADASTGRALSGVAEVLEFVGKEAVVRKELRFSDGALEAVIPATARLRIRAPGYTAETKSVFMDYEPLLSMMLSMRSEQLGEWSTFEKTRDLLRNVRLEFGLHKTAE
jgi:hypothetical protein